MRLTMKLYEGNREIASTNVYDLIADQDIERIKDAAMNGLKFPVANRSANPKHRHYLVLRAQEDLQLVNECLDRLNEKSRTPLVFVVSALYQARRQMIESDTAYQEAAWRLMAGCLLKEDEEPVEKAESAEAS